MLDLASTVIDRVYRIAKIFVAVRERSLQKSDVRNRREQLRTGDTRALAQGNQFYARYAHAHRKKQYPPYGIVCCSDSRCGPETLFDVNPGTTFVYRSAGGVIGDVGGSTLELGSELIKVRRVVMLSHEDCAALRSALKGDDGVPQEKIRELFEWYKVKTGDNATTPLALARAQALRFSLTSDSAIQRRIGRGDLKISYGCFSEKSGKVTLWSLDARNPMISQQEF